MKLEDIAKILLMILLSIEVFLSLIPGIVSPNNTAWLIALTLLGIGILALKSLLDVRPLYLKQYHGVVKLDGVFMMQVFIGVLTTFSYLGMLFFCLVFASSPVYEGLFNKLLTWSIVPGLIWGFFFGQSAIVRGVWPSRRQGYAFIIPLLVILMVVGFALVGLSLLGIILIAGWVADHWGDNAGIGVIILLGIFAAASIAVTFILIVPKP